MITFILHSHEHNFRLEYLRQQMDQMRDKYYLCLVTFTVATNYVLRSERILPQMRTTGY